MFRFYFVDHITGWLVFCLQLVALILAIIEYRRWKHKKIEDKKYDRLLQIYELAVHIQNALKEVQMNLEMTYLSLDQADSFSPYKFSEKYDQINNKFDELITDKLVQLKVQNEIIYNQLEMHKLHLKVRKLINFINDYQHLIFQVMIREPDRENLYECITAGEIVEGESNKNFNKKLNDLIEDISKEINQSSELITISDS